MKIKPIDRPPTFGVYKGTKITHYGTRSNGVINGYKLDIYTAKENGQIAQKLYYLADKAGKWARSKLVCFENGKKVKVIKSEGSKA